MLTKVVLDGPMGKAFGRIWNLSVESPAEAVSLIEANKPGFRAWIRNNLKSYANYKVVCKYEDGKSDQLDAEAYETFTPRRIVEIRFVPLIAGASSAAGRIVAGVVLVIVGAVMTYFGSAYGVSVMKAGGLLILGGAVELLSGKKTNDKTTDSGSSSLFDGPENTTEQGVPVQLIYGRQVLVGSHVVSARLTVDEQPI